MTVGERRAPRGPALGEASRWLSLAAAPAFAAMAFLTGVSDADPANLLCSAAHGSSPLGGMAPMYFLMSVVHLPPWLGWIAARGGGRQLRRVRLLQRAGGKAAGWKSSTTLPEGS